MGGNRTRSTGEYLYGDANEKYTCCMCGSKYDTLNQFYSSSSALYLNGHLPICKECLNRQFVVYTKKYNNPRRAMQRICMAFDLYYNDDKFDATDIQSKNFISEYIRTAGVRKALTFDNTLEEGFKLAGDKSYLAEVEDAKAKQQSGSKQDEAMWGAGFTKPQYKTLNEHYAVLKKSNPNCDSNQEIFIRDLCYIKMQQLDSMRDGRVDDFNKLTDSYRKTFAQAGLKAQEQGLGDDDIVGKWTELIERYTPSEYYDNKPLYEDYDGFDEYMRRNVKRPLINLITGSAVRDEEFSIEDGDEK